jgi:hypothetical protein
VALYLAPRRKPSQFLEAQKYSDPSLSFQCIKNRKGIAIMTTSRHNTVHAVSSFAGAEEEFEAAWRDPNCTQFALPPVGYMSMKIVLLEPKPKISDQEETMRAGGDRVRSTSLPARSRPF